MWNRMELKWKAKETMRGNYWAAVIVSLILAVLAEGTGGSAGREGARVSVGSEYNVRMGSLGTADTVSRRFDHALDIVDHSPWGFLLAVVSLGAFLVIVVLAVFFGILIGNVLQVGCREFFIENMYSRPGVGKVLCGFRSGSYWNIVKTMFLRDLYVTLWSLLLVIPGIVKYYEYYLVPYLLAEYPDMPSEEAFARSRDMMYGNKMDTFLLELSFFPWMLASAVSMGILGIFYVNPYINATKAELYDAIVRGR